MDSFDEMAVRLVQDKLGQGQLKVGDISQALRSVHAERNEEVEKLRAEVEGLRKERVEWANVRDTLAAEVDGMKNKIKAMSHDAAADRKMRERAEERADIYIQERDTFAADLRVVRHRLDMIRGVALQLVRRWRGERNEARKKADTLTDENKRLWAENTTLRNEKRAVENESEGRLMRLNTLAAENVRLMEALTEICAGRAERGVSAVAADALRSSPSTAKWSRAWEALVKEHDGRRIAEDHRPQSSSMLLEKELSDAADSALKELK